MTHAGLAHSGVCRGRSVHTVQWRKDPHKLSSLPSPAPENRSAIQKGKDDLKEGERGKGKEKRDRREEKGGRKSEKRRRERSPGRRGGPGMKGQSQGKEGRDKARGRERETQALKRECSSVNAACRGERSA